MKVLIAPAPLANLDGPFLHLLKENGFEPVYPAKPQQMVEDELMAILPGVSASLAGSEPYSRRVLDAHPQLRVIARAGVGYDAVDTKAATDHGAAVCIAAGTNQGSVAEQTFGLMLALSREIVAQNNSVKAGGWPRKALLPLRGRTIGIAGLGRIGKAVATRALAFDMKVIAYDPFPDIAFCTQHKIPLVTLDQVVAESDYLSVHIPATPETKHIFNKQMFAKMKPTAFFINTSRGALVNEADLLEVLKAGKLAGAGLDVFEQEPTPPNHPLFALPNVIVTPHAAGVDVQSRDDMAYSAAKSIVTLMKGGWSPDTVVNPEVKAKFKW
jgi:D-3-phosphoglycerate dehydrogenase